MIDEAEAGVVEAGIDDTGIDENVRGLLVCMWGNAFAGTNRIDDAAMCYNWVLTYFTNETHAGSSAAYSLALMEQRKHTDDPAVGIAALEEFVAEHPGSTYSAEALMEVADAQLRSQDEALASETLARIEREYWDTSMAAKAQTRRDDLARQVTEAE
jgi:predicted negative regulator of RcsB-dependent stress response